MNAPTNQIMSNFLFLCQITVNQVVRKRKIVFFFPICVFGQMKFVHENIQKLSGVVFAIEAYYFGIRFVTY